MGAPVTVVPAARRWPAEHIVALAPDAASAVAARRLAVPDSWAATGCDVAGVWGLFRGSGAEPYQVVVELAEPATRCSCPSRKLPCKHAVALLLLWSSGAIDDSLAPPFAAEFFARRAARDAARAARRADPITPEETTSGGAAPLVDPSIAGTTPPSDRGQADKRAAERAARVAAGLAELDRWLADCIRGGLAAPALSSYATWDAVAARLTDAQCGSLANRIRRLAGVVGTRAGWHEDVLADFGQLHLIANAGRLGGRLAEPLEHTVRAAIGFSPRQDDVRLELPCTDRWIVAGRSDRREDRLVVRRTWLWGETGERWAMILSFAAYGDQLDTTLVPGRAVHADLHFYPAAAPLRALVGHVHEREPQHTGGPPPATLDEACHQIGAALSAEPWLERHPLHVRAAPTYGDGRWLLTDHSGALPIAGQPESLPTLLAVSAGRPLELTAEWSPDGLLPLAAHVEGRTVDLGPPVPWGRP